MREMLRLLYRGENQFDFPRHWKRMLTLSAVLVVISLAALFIRGLNLSIDFEGGTAVEVRTEASVTEVRDSLDSALTGAKIQELTDDNGRLVRVQTDIKDPVEAETVRTGLEQFGEIDSFESVGPTWGNEVTDKAIQAVIVFFIAIALYIAIRLEWKMAVGALIAVAHDIIVTVGFYAVFHFVVSPSTIVAFLTIMGYSLYDTVVVYDKVQEVSGRVGASGKYTYTEMMNLALNRVIMRSINASLTSVLPVLSMLVVGSVFLGAVTLREFAVALLVGLIVGAYSSIFVASSFVAFMKEREPRFVDIRERQAAKVGAVVDGDGTRMIGRTEASLGAVRPSEGRPSTGSVTKRRHVERPAGGSGTIPPRPRKKRRR